MADLYEKNGVILLDDNGTSLRGCCCKECALVSVNVRISSYSVAPGSGGSGTHTMESGVAGVCSAFVRVAASTMAELWYESAEHTCAPSPACGSASAAAGVVYMGAYAKVPFKRGNTETRVGYGAWSSTKVNVGSSNNTARWTIEVKYYAQDGGAVTSATMKPNVRVNVDGTNYSTNGTDRTWADFKTTTATPGGTMGSFGWNIYFT